MQIKATMRYHFITTKIAIIKKRKIKKCWWGCTEIGILVHCQWECNMLGQL